MKIPFFFKLKGFMALSVKISKHLKEKHKLVFAEGV